MLHKYEKIDDAMSACVALEFPLIVIVHGKLPNSVCNAEEAAREAGSASVTRTYSFLPPSYSTGTSHAFMSASLNCSTSLFADDTVPFESTLNAPSQDAANANAALGFLMRPANLSATAAADRAAVATAVADGEELTLVPDFPLGSLVGGAAQREAMLITLLESRLGSLTLLHLIEEGTPAYDAFTAAVPVPGAGPNGADGSAVLPRVHVFYAPTVGLSPMVLHGAALTPQNLHSCVQMGMLRPRKRTGDAAATPGASASPAAGLRSFFVSSVSSMDAEYQRSRQKATPSSAPAPSSATAAPAMSAPAVRATGVSRADSLAAAHLIAVAGLPTCFSTASITGSSSNNTNTAAPASGSHKTILTTPSMTMQTVWRAVEKHLEWAQHEVQQAQAASVWNGVVPPKPGAKFTLTVASGAEAAAVTVKTPAEAAGVRLHDFPRNTIVQVVFDGAPSGEVSALRPAQAQAQAQTPSQPPQAHASADYVCEGDVCRRRAPDEAPPTSSSPTAPPSSAPPNPTSTAAPTTGAAATSIKLHCSLPNGKTLDVEDLDPAVATLQSNVRPAVEAALGYSNFIFVCAYPAKRYSAEADEPRVLQEVGLARSSALRVVALDGPGVPDASSAPAQQAQAGLTRQMLSSAASSLLGMFAGRRPNPGQGGQSINGGSSSTAPAPAPAPPSRRTYNSMAEMLAANESAERETAMERLRQEQQRQQALQQDPADAEARPQGKKSNRYFGGGSTEYVAEDKDKDDEDAGNTTEAMSAEEQSAFLREQLQRLMRQQRRRTGEGAEEDEEEAEEEDGQRGTANRASRPHAFQGQGRRLAGDATTSTNAPQPASSQPPPAPDAAEAKKNQ